MKDADKKEYTWTYEGTVCMPNLMRVTPSFVVDEISQTFSTDMLMVFRSTIENFHDTHVVFKKKGKIADTQWALSLAELNWAIINLSQEPELESSSDQCTIPAADNKLSGYSTKIIDRIAWPKDK